MTPKVRSLFEFWPPCLFYPPVLAYALWLALRHRGLMLPTVANPSIYSGGMILESKSQILSLIPEGQQAWVAPWVAIAQQKSGGTSAAGAVAIARRRLEEADLSFPLVAKPDIGQRGAGVRPVHDAQQLADYLSASPAGETLILQRLVPWEHEAGIFYYRLPGEERGQIFSVTLKEFPALTGDGARTLRQLILGSPRARLLRRVYFERHAALLSRVLAPGERFPLVFAGNHCQGAIFRNGAAVVTPALEARINQIGSSIPGFFFGRFDLRFRSLEELRRGEAFQIVELNGASAEATHIWDPDARLFDAYRTLFSQFQILFEIGARNRARGHAPLGLVRFLRDLRTYSSQVKSYPTTA